MEENANETQDNSLIEKARVWTKENLRIIVSIVIVVVIAGGIYSYSKRTAHSPEETAIVPEKEMTEEQVLEELSKLENKESSSENQKAEEKNGDEEKNEELKEKNNSSGETTAEEEQVTSASTSRETEKSFIETAEKGEGVTHLARRALANYLEKSPDSELSLEHKIYIEDYLRKKVGFSERVHIGTKIEFSKELIKESITEAKKLNERQLNNLHKYVILAPSLS